VRTRLLLNCGSVACPLFVGTFVIVGRRRGGYSPQRDPVSALALGESGWVQIASFLTTGGLMCASAAGVRRELRSGTGTIGLPVAIGAVGMGLIGAGLFPTDAPANDGEGPTTDTPSRLTRNGALHVAFSVLVFVGLPVACLIGAHRFWTERRFGWTEYSVASGVVGLIASALAGAGFAGDDRLGHRAGTWQRIAIIAGLGWTSCFSRHLARTGGI
jgi:hypothetical protein